MNFQRMAGKKTSQPANVLYRIRFYGEVQRDRDLRLHETEVVLSGPAEQVARGSISEDVSGRRQTTIRFEQVTWTGTVAGSLAWTYDNNFAMTTEAVDGVPVSFGYDADGLLATAGALTLRRDAVTGDFTGSTLGAVSDSYQYNQFGEVTAYTANYQDTTLMALNYQRDAGGRIVATGTRGYGYDDAGRLVAVTEGGASAAEYEYDANGNRTVHRWVGGSNTATYDAQDRLLTYGDTTYEYTANDEVASKTLAGATTTYHYDSLGELDRVILPGGMRVEYVVDGENRRIGRKVNGTLQQGWLYSDGLRIAAELDGNQAVVSRFVYASRTNVPDFMIKAGVTYRILSDHLGSPRLVVNGADGTIAQRLEYDEFGRVTSDTNPGFQPFGFAGGLYDRDTGLVRFGARDYDPHTGRWTTKEQLGFGGGDSNFYSYAFSDPVNLIDPNGLYAGWDDAAFIVGGALVGAAGQGFSDIVSGEFSGWGAYGRAAAGGAVGGIVSLYAGPVAGGAAGAAVTNVLNQNSAINAHVQCEFIWSSLVLDTAVGAGTGLAFGAGNMSGGVRNGSAGHVFKSMRTALRNGTISGIRPATGVKMFVGAAEEYQITASTAVGVVGSHLGTQLGGSGSPGCGCR